MVSKEDVHYLDEDSLQKLFNASNLLGRTVMPKWKIELMFKLIYQTAARVSEILSLTKKDIDFGRKRFMLKQSKTGKKKCPKCKGDGNIKNLPCKKCHGNGFFYKIQELYCSPHLFTQVTNMTSEITNPNEKLFPISRMGAWKMMNKCAQIAKIEVHHIRAGDDDARTSVYPHLLRHSMAVHMLGKGFTLSEVQTKLRHSSPSTTMIYTKVNPQHVQDKENRMYGEMTEQIDIDQKK